MTRKKHKPSSPEEIAARKRERDEALVEKVRLEAQGVTVTIDGPTGKISRAMRYDVFHSLHTRDALSLEAYNAFRDHEQTVSTAAGWETPERRPDHIRATTEGAPGQNITQRMIDAGKLENYTLEALSPADAKLLDGLMEPGAALAGRWHYTVERITGETRPECKAARIRALGDNLPDARHRAKSRMEEDRRRHANDADDFRKNHTLATDAA